MDTHYNPEEWYTTLPLLPGLSKTTILGNDPIEEWDDEQVDIAKNLIKQTGEWSSYEDTKAHLGKKARPICLVSLRLLCLGKLQALYGRRTVSQWIQSPRGDLKKYVIGDAWRQEIKDIRMPLSGWVKPKCEGYMAHHQHPGHRANYHCTRCLCLWNQLNIVNCCKKRWVNQNKKQLGSIQQQ